jgi:putative ABC transport system permease protein
VFDPGNDGLTLLTSFQTLTRADPALEPDLYAIGLRPGTNPFVYQEAIKLPGSLSSGSRDTHGSPIPYVIALTGALVLLLASAAALGVVNTVVLQTRERTHELGVFKAVGATPRQALAMVACWVASTGLAAGVLAVAAGVTVHHYLIPRIALFAGNATPPSFLNVYPGWEIAALTLAGLVIAVAGALLPAGWAARIPAASALRAE